MMVVSSSWSILPPVTAFSPSTSSSILHARGNTETRQQLQQLHASTTNTTDDSSSTQQQRRRPDTITKQSEELANQLIQTMNEESMKRGKEYASSFDLDEVSAGLFTLMDAIRIDSNKETSSLLGVQGYPFVLRKKDLTSVGLDAQNFFTMSTLEKAVQDDFLDAARGSTDNRKGWQITTVSNPRGESFEEATNDL